MRFITEIEKKGNTSAYWQTVLKQNFEASDVQLYLGSQSHDFIFLPFILDYQLLLSTTINLVI